MNCSLDLRLQVLTGLSVVAVTTSLASLVFRFEADLMFNKPSALNHWTTEMMNGHKSIWGNGQHQEQRKQQQQQLQPTVATGERSALEFTLVYTIWNTYLAALSLIYSPSSDASRGQS
ncbi:hypothetical protein FBUS_02507 [Fasciolopsis buskii]|uniref:Uncharacterized protein n=1 Tax=Fasciolopsis buskii TaxID=27845 RepID=A0A8E0RT52_9TREM|nr:hypothetical protein FBUS_02507 [Fasciolopsis buski]